MLGWLSELIAPVANIGKQWLQNKAAVKQAEHEVKVSILANKARLAIDAQTHNSLKEMKQLEVASPWVRWVITAHILAVLDVGVFFPEKAAEVYQNLELMPTWLVGLFITVFGFYFAVSKLSENGASMVAAWKGGK